MRTSQLLLATVKETPADAEIISHQLMLRAGMMRKLASGLYTWLPLGFRVLKKVEAIIREEMNRSGAQEILMPTVQPAELWEETQRWDQYGPMLLKMRDRHERQFCFGPTHEEIVTDLCRRELKSYKQLPMTLYQIQTKFRDEIRPRFGVMRAREFIMKDAYSFHIDEQSLVDTYQVMYDAYSKIFDRIGLDYRPVQADSGEIGGDNSHEFHVLAASGEDLIAYSENSDYAANTEKATAALPPADKEDQQPLEKISTPGQKTIEAVSEFLSIPANKSVKTLIVKGQELPLIALVLKGDDNLNEVKAQNHPDVASPLTFATDEEIEQALGCSIGSLGPVKLSIPMLVDQHAAQLCNFCCGANEDDYHYTNVNWDRDCETLTLADIREVKEGDMSPDNSGPLSFLRGIEVGHIFQLGKKYSEAMNATVLNEKGSAETMAMGCYGIGVTRIIAAAIEQNHDDNGIIWPQAIAPFDVAIIPVNQHKSERVAQFANELYEKLQSHGLDVMLDDRKDRPGVLFADCDLIGIPHRFVISDRGLDADQIEYKSRSAQEAELFNLADIDTLIQSTLQGK